MHHIKEQKSVLSAIFEVFSRILKAWRRNTF